MRGLNEAVLRRDREQAERASWELLRVLAGCRQASGNDRYEVLRWVPPILEIENEPRARAQVERVVQFASWLFTVTGKGRVMEIGADTPEVVLGRLFRDEFD